MIEGLHLTDLGIPANGIYRPPAGSSLFYFSVINRAWCQVESIDASGQSIAVYVLLPDGDPATLIVHKMYSPDMVFLWGHDQATQGPTLP